jgi:3-hydroxyacyl-CoA dehydrogenase
VVGTGMMGPGIAVTLALAGHPAVLFGRTAESLGRGLAAATHALDFLRASTSSLRGGRTPRCAESAARQTSPRL